MSTDVHETDQVTTTPDRLLRALRAAYRLGAQDAQRLIVGAIRLERDGYYGWDDAAHSAAGACLTAASAEDVIRAEPSWAVVLAAFGDDTKESTDV